MGRPKGSKNKNPKTLEERFWEKVDIKSEQECWEWQAYIHPSGYGNIAWNRRMWGVHQISWILHFGEIPEGICVLHHCDNRICVNPNHLFLGTYKDNAVDRDKKGRGKIPDNKGENHGMSKLVKEDVLLIRKAVLEKGASTVELARIYEVSEATIFDILTKRSWAWLE